MKNLITLAALFSLTTGLAGADGHPIADWDRIESEISPTGYVPDSGTPVAVEDHAFADWDRIESGLHPTGRDIKTSIAVGSGRRLNHPGVGDQDSSAAMLGSIEYYN
jgi:hypothetical protein